MQRDHRRAPRIGVERDNRRRRARPLLAYRSKKDLRPQPPSDFGGNDDDAQRFFYPGEDLRLQRQRGAREGAPFIAAHMIRRAEKAFDDFAGGSDPGLNRKLLGLS